MNAHKFPAPFGAQGVLGFVDNGDLASTAGQPPTAVRPGGSAQARRRARREVPGVAAQAAGRQPRRAAGPGRAGQAWAAIPGARTPRAARPGRALPPYRRHDPPPAAVPGTAAQQAFISLVAPGAIAAQQRYGIPAAVTIAQAIDESGWGQSELATADHNLFGIKGTGPAGRDTQPTREYENGAWVTRTASFRVYHNIAESIEDHSRLLATGPAYQRAMANRHLPDAFATALTGVYATDPGYGSNLIALMRLYHLYRYDSARRPPPDAGRDCAARRGQRRGPGRGPQAAVPGVPADRRARPAGRWAFRGWRARWPSARCGRARPEAAQRASGSRGGESAQVQRAARGRRPEPGQRPEPRQRPGPRIAPRGPLPGTRRTCRRSRTR